MDDAAQPALLPLAMLHPVRTKPVILNHAQLAAPTCHLDIRRYVLVLTIHFHLFVLSGHTEKGSPPKFHIPFSSARNDLHAHFIMNSSCCNNYWLTCIVKLLLSTILHCQINLSFVDPAEHVFSYHLQ
jgi:hypothetical protein